MIEVIIFIVIGYIVLSIVGYLLRFLAPLIKVVVIIGILYLIVKWLGF